MVLEDGTERMSRNVPKLLSNHESWYRSRANAWTTPRRKPEVSQGFKSVKRRISGRSDSLHKILISVFRRDVDDICALLGYYTASCGNSLPTFRGNVSVPSSRVNMGQIRCAETSVNNYHTTPRNTPEQRRSLHTICVLLLMIYFMSDAYLKESFRFYCGSTQ
jgi:hypothetical protein